VDALNAQIDKIRVKINDLENKLTQLRIDTKVAEAVICHLRQVKDELIDIQNKIGPES
jgi:hypothetical protein